MRWSGDGVVVEGPCDAILLPTFLRDAAALSSLRYRIVPGLSELARNDVSRIDVEAGRLLCLVDGDPGGEDLRDMLIDGGIPEDRIYDLGVVNDGATLVDLVDPTVLYEAFAEEIETWAGGEWVIEPEAAPSVRRWQWLIERADADGIDTASVSKTRVAQRIVDSVRKHGDGMGRTGAVDPDYGESVHRLHEEIERALDFR